MKIQLAAAAAALLMISACTIAKPIQKRSPSQQSAGNSTLASWLSLTASLYNMQRLLQQNLTLPNINVSWKTSMLNLAARSCFTNSKEVHTKSTIIQSFFLQMAPSGNAEIDNEINRICALTKADLVNKTYDPQNNITAYRTQTCQRLVRDNCSVSNSSSSACQLSCSDNYIKCNGEDTSCQYSMTQFCLGQIFNAYTSFANTISVNFIEGKKANLLQKLGSITNY